MLRQRIRAITRELYMTAREAVVVAEMRSAGAAAALDASLDRTAVLVAGERHPLGELPARIADGD